MVSVLEKRAYIGDQHEILSDGSIHIPGPGVLLKRFGVGSTTLTCTCHGGCTGTCTTTSTPHTAVCSNGSCNNCSFVSTSTGLVADQEFLPELLSE